MNETPTRPLMRYHGGKWRLAQWIISHFPEHRVYVEPYGGAASVLLQKPRSFAEVYNDLDSEIVNVFRVIRNNETAAELVRLLELTPCARDEFDGLLDVSEDPVEQARRTIARSFMGYSSDSATRANRTGFRGLSVKTARYSAREWSEYPNNLRFLIERLQGVVIENIPALELIQRYDAEHTLFYLDPPYPHETRFAARGYKHEMTNDDHVELIETLKTLAGKVILSGYRCELYDELLCDWRMVSKSARGQAGNHTGSKINTECLWISPNAVVQESLFNG